MLLALFLLSCKAGESTVQSSDFEVTSRNNVNRVRLSNTGGGENKVEIIIRARGQMTSSNPKNIQLQGSSGVEEQTSFIGYDDVSFPFRGNVAFDYVKQANDVTGSLGETESLATTVRASVSFRIEEQGYWRVHIYY